jgi:hypothetical protein
MLLRQIGLTTPAVAAIAATALLLAGCSGSPATPAPRAAAQPSATVSASAPVQQAPVQQAPVQQAPGTGQQTPGAQAPAGQLPGTAASLPLWNVCYPNGTGNMPLCPQPLPGEVAYEPSVMVPDEDGSGVFRDLHWTSWTSSSAAATGTGWISNCKPACGDGTKIPYPIRVTLDQPVTYHGQLYFNRLTTYYLNNVPLPTQVQTPLVGP